MSMPRVPRACVAFLRDNGADVRNIEDEYPGVGLFQRFLVMNDPTVGRFLVRDCDARLSAAEAELVQQWIDSGYPFHVVRDHVLHNELMIGCTVGRTHRLRHRHRRVDAALFYVRAHREIRPRPAHARPHAMAADPRPLPGSRQVLPLPGVHTVPLARPEQPFRRRPPEYGPVLDEVERLGIPRVL